MVQFGGVHQDQRPTGDCFDHGISPDEASTDFHEILRIVKLAEIFPDILPVQPSGMAGLEQRSEMGWKGFDGPFRDGVDLDENSVSVRGPAKRAAHQPLQASGANKGVGEIDEARLAGDEATRLLAQGHVVAVVNTIHKNVGLPDHIAPQDAPVLFNDAARDGEINSDHYVIPAPVHISGANRKLAVRMVTAGLKKLGLGKPGFGVRTVL